MNAIVEYAPLVALLSPVLVLAALNAWLALSGEEGTLLLPSRHAYPVVALPEMARPAPVEGSDLDDQVAVEPEFRKAA